MTRRGLAIQQSAEVTELLVVQQVPVAAVTVQTIQVVNRLRLVGRDLQGAVRPTAHIRLAVAAAVQEVLGAQHRMRVSQGAVAKAASASLAVLPALVWGTRAGVMVAVVMTEPALGHLKLQHTGMVVAAFVGLVVAMEPLIQAVVAAVFVTLAPQVRAVAGL
jgi:hypothetical protein